jgi:hypothetical protein
MAFWKNKHVALASVMAPVLGLVSYFGIGAMFGEKPRPAAAGQSYQLIEKPNCRYDSGLCGLKNVDFELPLSFERLDHGRMLLKLESVNPLDGVKLALVENADEEEKPVDMQATGGDGLNWVVEIRSPDPERDRLRLVASSRQTLYFGDVATKFTASESASETSK